MHSGDAREAGKLNLLTGVKNPDRTLRHPHDMKSGVDAPEAGSLIKKVLADQPDGCVLIAPVGFFTNLAGLLDDPEAKALAAQKVRLLSLMMGTFQTVNHNTRHLEYQVKLDVSAAQKLAKVWPTPLVRSGFETSMAAAFPPEVVEHDLDYLPHHPLKEACYLYNPPPDDRPIWDPTSTLHAIYQTVDVFEISPPGTVNVQEDEALLLLSSAEGSGRHPFLV